MVLTSPNYPSVYAHQNNSPKPGPRPDGEAVLVQLDSAMNTDHPFKVSGDKWQCLWLSPGAAEFVVTGKNGHVLDPAKVPAALLE
jgi:hypothetical protein